MPSSIVQINHIFAPPGNSQIEPARTSHGPVLLHAGRRQEGLGAVPKSGGPWPPGFSILAVARPRLRPAGRDFRIPHCSTIRVQSSRQFRACDPTRPAEPGGDQRSFRVLSGRTRVSGGGFEKAAALADRIGRLNPAEYHWAQARLAERRKEFDTAEQQFRRAAELAPQQLGLWIDLAKFLANTGQYQRSEEAFQRAERVDPNAPKLLFARASTYIRIRRNLEAARNLLKRYLESPLTPDDPPRREAELLLRQASSI